MKVVLCESGWSSSNNFWMMGMPEASPVFRMPVLTRTPPESPIYTLPTGLFFSVNAFCGQSKTQPPQEWQISSLINNWFLM